MRNKNQINPVDFRRVMVYNSCKVKLGITNDEL
jgi:hypothetical protein